MDRNAELLMLRYMCDLFLKRSLINVLKFLFPFCHSLAFIHGSYCPLLLLCPQLKDKGNMTVAQILYILSCIRHGEAS